LIPMKSTNGGVSWSNIIDTLSCPTVSAIAVSYLASDNTVWFSTGSGFNGDGPQIGRVYKSTNGGSSWTRITAIPEYISWVSKIEVNIFRNEHVYIGTDFGLFKTTNGGTSFTNVLSGQISDVVTYTNLIAADTLNILAGVIGTGIKNSTNGGASFSNAALPNFNSAICSRITLANDKATSKTFSLISKNNGRFLGMWSSTDKGASWVHRSLPDSAGQAYYNSALAVAPNGRVIAGSNFRQTHYSANDGVSWIAGNYCHEDIHRLFVYNNSLMFQVSDGGIYKSTNLGVDWVDAGGNWITISQSYHLTADNSNPNILWTGLQDNGINQGYDDFLKWNNLSCCDGGDYLRAGSYQYMNLAGLGDNSGNRYQRKLITVPLTDPWEAFSQGLMDGQPWTAAGMNDFKNFSGSFYTSMKQFVYKTNGESLPWIQLGVRPHPSFDWWVGRILPITGYVLAGFDQPTTPAVRRYNNSSNQWETPDLSILPSNIRVTDFDNGSSPGRVFMTISGTNTARVFRSANNGANWTNITGNLPALINTSCILADKSNDEIIYVGSDFGVFVTGNGGVNWYNFAGGLPSVCYVKDMEFAAGNNFIYAATYGRGVWKSSILIGIKNISQAAESFSLSQNYPNPFNPVTNIKFSLPKSAHIKLTVYDVTGKEVAVLVNEIKKSGGYEVDFDASNLASGVYFYQLKSDNFYSFKKMVLVK